MHLQEEFFRTKSLLREFIDLSIAEVRVKLPLDRKLRVFDFDDTLVKTKSLIHVSRPDGSTFDLTPGEYAVYDKNPDDSFDFGDFSRLIDPEEIKWTVDILRRITTKGSEAVILTARAHEGPVHQFLADAGIPAIPVIALANSDPQAKADYIARRIEEDGLAHVEFFDDSPKNVAAVEGLKPLYPGVRISVRHVVGH